MRRERRRRQVFRARRGCGRPARLKTREERAEARARVAVNATRLSPEDDWQSCDEFYSDAEENARSLIHASDVSLTDVRGSSRLIVSLGCAIRPSKTTEFVGETRWARGT